jgi:hypothetical protein
MRRLFTAGIAVPLILALVGGGLIVASQLDLDPTALASLPQIPDVTPSPNETPTVTPSPSPGVTPMPTPSPTPIPDTWVAVQIQIASVGINVRVRKSTSAATDYFPTEDAAYILRKSLEPGRGGNVYMIAHAELHLFKPLWNVLLGDEVKILMSDGQVLRYVVTEIHPNQSCPDTRAPADPSPPPALRDAAPGCPATYWSKPTDHERLSLQTSQGFNRNYGELVVVADPLF